VPNLTELSEARINALQPLQVGDYGIIVISIGVVGRGKFLIIPILCKAPTFFQSQHFTPRQGAKMASIVRSASRRMFPRYPTRRFKFLSTCTLDNSALCHLPPISIALINQFLTLGYKKSPRQHGSILELSPEDLNRFRTLTTYKQLQAALKLSRK
jgi:hypothetical protein